MYQLDDLGSSVADKLHCFFKLQYCFITQLADMIKTRMCFVKWAYVIVAIKVRWFLLTFFCWFICCLAEIKLSVVQLFDLRWVMVSQFLSRFNLTFIAQRQKHFRLRVNDRWPIFNSHKQAARNVYVHVKIIVRAKSVVLPFCS